LPLADSGFDVVWGFALDSMHNLFLGVAKRLYVRFWTNSTYKVRALAHSFPFLTL
jgi:hypothetical protein